MSNEREFKYKHGTLNPVSRDLDSLVYDHPDEVTPIQRLRRMTSGTESIDRNEITSWTGYILKVLETSDQSDFSHAQTFDLKNPSGDVPRQFIVRIPELHAAIPEPVTTNPEEPGYDDICIELHDVFTIFDLSIPTPSPGDLVQCDFVNRYNLSEGVITSVPHKPGTFAGGIIIGAGGVLGSLANLFNGTNLISKSPSDDSVPKGWEGNAARWSQSKKLMSMDKALSGKVRIIIERLRARGFQPKIFYGWRSPAVQRKIYEAGNSKVLFSFHNAMKNGQPNSYGADIVDERWHWEQGTKRERESFWAALGEEAKNLGLIWGGDWKFKDVAHVQLLKNRELAKVKRESGIATA